MSKRSDGDQRITSVGASPGAIRAVPWWVRAAVILGALLAATGAVIALVHPIMLVSPRDEINGAVRIYAGYFASRNIALALMLLVLLALGARRALANLMVLVAFIQVLDALMDCLEGRWNIVPGVLVFGLIFFIPILGLAIGAATGALLGSLADVGISDSFIKTVRDKVTPGTSALFLLSSDAVYDRVKSEFQATDAELISTNLSADQEAKLREAFAHED